MAAVAAHSAVVAVVRSEVAAAVDRAAAVAATAAVTDKADANNFYRLANGRRTLAGRFVLREASPQIAASPHSRILKYTL